MPALTFTFINDRFIFLKKFFKAWLIVSMHNSQFSLFCIELILLFKLLLWHKDSNWIVRKFMAMCFDTLDKTLTFLLAFEHKHVICQWRARLLSIFILSSSSEKLACFDVKFYGFIGFVSYGLIKKWLLLELGIKPFSWNRLNTLVTLDSQKFIT